MNIWVVLAVAFVTSIVLTPIVRAIAERLSFYARPSADRWHQKPVALLGGVAMAASFALAVIASAPLRPLLPVLLCSLLMFTTVMEVIQELPVAVVAK